MAYTDTVAVAEELGVTFTSDQEAQADGLIADAAALIERRTGRDWDATSPATETLPVPADGVLRLANLPVVAVSSVSVRRPYIGASSTALTAGSTYELLDAARGHVLVRAYYAGDLATVTYTHSSGVPDLLARAATLKVAAWMERRLTAEASELAGVQQISFGQDLTVKFGSQSATDRESEADRIIRSFAPSVVFA